MDDALHYGMTRESRARIRLIAGFIIDTRYVHDGPSVACFFRISSLDVASGNNFSGTLGAACDAFSSATHAFLKAVIAPMRKLEWRP